MYPVATEARIEELRHAAQVRELTIEESREVIRLIRQERVSASAASAGTRAKKAASAPIDVEALMAKLKAA
jgi:hypothetical protein